MFTKEKSTGGSQSTKDACHAAQQPKTIIAHATQSDNFLRRWRASLLTRWRSLGLVLVLALVVPTLLLPGSVSAASATPRGMVALYQDSGHISFPQASQAGEDAIAIDLDDGTCSPTHGTIYPSTIEPHLGNPFCHVLLRTEGGACGYDWSHVQNLIEGLRPD
ncbi:MAG TPA: hypothetical protein VKU87_07115, partial [Thermomicrobiaceae bacterium]|nr:hypothetical protein [Thermomicrobiaceae bacterium]